MRNHTHFAAQFVNQIPVVVDSRSSPAVQARDILAARREAEAAAAAVKQLEAQQADALQAVQARRLWGL